MSKLLSTLIAVAFAAVSLTAGAATPTPSAADTSAKPAVQADAKSDTKAAPKKAKKAKKAKKTTDSK
jgi:Ni/Co efflux regulator RcnB